MNYLIKEKSSTCIAKTEAGPNSVFLRQLALRTLGEAQEKKALLFTVCSKYLSQWDKRG